MKKINITITEFEGDQLEINLNLDRPTFSICPKCSAQVIQLSEGCTACGWLEVQPKPIIKTRRQPGEGSGHIYYRTVTRNGKDYQQAYYQWRDNGKQKTKYIPNKLLNEIKQAESRKLPVEDILVLLLGTGKCSSKKSKDRCSSKIIPSSKNSEDKCSSKKIPSSKKRRDKGKGSGWIRCKPITKNGKQYKQYWYYYETWSEGSRMVQSSKYIPKKMESKIIRMNNEKAPVEKILKVLESKSQRRK